MTTFPAPWRKPVTIAIGICVLTLPLTVSAQVAATEIYDRASKAYGALRSIDAQFDQTITNPLLGQTVTSHGRFLQQRPDLISITFTDPVGDRIVSDGKFLWVYLPSSTPGQVLRLPANAEGAGIVNLLGQFLDAPKQSFAISGGDAATVDAVATHKVQLVPRANTTAPFQRATLWIDDRDARIRRVQIIDAQGVDRTITLTTWGANTALANAAFKFAPPKGVKVVTSFP
ncbi:MAG: outer membrane lipoprotein carrier protein LolA [Gemmatimonadota bacterium]|nr:outer membrane lipoprotein carrier protein LolA [Gemmatimonadota bacterium]